ncbi:MAG: SBBP repeat-containing protein [Blastocatellia bacterium]
MSFEANHGQTDESAEFIARGPGYTLFLNSSEAIFALKRDGETFRSNKSAIIHNQGQQSAIRLKLLGASASSAAEAIDPLPGRSNYFIGNDPNLWRTDVPNYSRVRYRDVYPGVDVVYYGAQRRLEYDFVIAPHSDPQRIKLSFEGTDEIELDEQGDLLVGAGGEQMRMRKPVVYQEVNGERRSIEGHYAIRNRPPEMAAIRNPTVGFQIGDYDANQTLIIDPIVDYSTFFGGSATDIAYGIAVDEQGNAYITGQTSSPNFPTKNPLEAALSGANDAFVTKLNAQGNTVVFSTYIGGRNPGDKSWAIAVDQAGNIYFTGETTSVNFPTVNAAQPNYRGGIDAFAAKLSNDGAVLLYSTYLGGALPEVAYSIALDRFDNAYITGRAESLNFPTKNPLQSSLRGQRDAFVTKFSADGEIVFSTYLGSQPATGGRDEEVGYGIAIDALSNIYITGFTSSPNFPLVNPIQGDFGGVEDAFVTKLNPAASAIVYSTFLGGDRTDNGRGIAVDGQGAAYVTGYTLSTNFPHTNAMQPLYGGSGDAFVAKLNAAGTALIYSTFLGGSGSENSGLASDITPSCAIAVDSLGHAYVTGRTDSPNFPVVRAIQAELRGDTDAFVAKIDPAGSALIFSTLWGSTFTGLTGFDERGLSIAIDRNGSVYVTGQMLKSDFPTFSAVQRDYGGGLSDAFITKISAPDIVSVAPVSAASFNGASLAPEQIVAAFGLGLANGTEIATTVPLPTSLLGASVKVKDKMGVERSAPLFFVSPNQINFQIPPGTATGKTTITIANQPNANLSATVWVENTAPGLFAANANGQGVAAAVALRVRQDGSFAFEPVAQPDGQGRFIAVPIDLGAETDQVFLILFGTGIRNRSAIEKVIVQVGGVAAPVLFAGAQGSFVGQDQVNVRLPRTLAGRGEAAVTMTVDGQIANSVSVNIR